MIDDTNTQAVPTDFAAFEAKAKEPDAEPRKEEDTPPPEVNDKVLELGGDDAPELTDEQKAEAEGKKRNHRDPIKRINILTAQLREAERERDALRSRPAEAPVKEAAPDPNAKNEDGSDKYEFGEADSAFLKDMARFEGRQAYREEREKEAEDDKKTAATREITGKLETGIASIEKAGPEKYADFEAKINEAVEARGGEPLHPMVSIGIAVSPAGADIAYRLATDEAASTKIEALAKSNPRAAAMEFGELEGQYLDNEDDTDLDLNDPLDMARMIGRERARRKGLSKSATVERKVTKAPEPAEHRSRGANGQFETRPDTDNFGDFEKMVNRKTG